MIMIHGVDVGKRSDHLFDQVGGHTHFFLIHFLRVFDFRHFSDLANLGGRALVGCDCRACGLPDSDEGVAEK